MGRDSGAPTAGEEADLPKEIRKRGHLNANPESILTASSSVARLALAFDRR
jgi:hypothetical protein